MGNSRMPDVPEEYRVTLTNFTEHDLNGSFVSFFLESPMAKGHGVIRTYALGEEKYAVEIAAMSRDGGDGSRFLTQSEVASIHFGVRSDGIKELRIGSF